MIRSLTPPSAGQPIRASFFAELLREIRANRPLAGKNTRVTRTPNGTHISAIGGTSGRSAPAKDIGRFAIASITPDGPPGGSEEDQTYTATVANPYYDIGGKTYEMSGGESGEVILDGIKDGSIIFIKIAAEGSGTVAELGTALSLAELQSLQENEPGKYTIPLYKVEGGSITCDFRTGPVSAMGEA